MLQDMKITEQEYNKARKDVAQMVLCRYRQAIEIIPTKDPEFEQFLCIKIKKYQKNAQNLLSQDKDLKIIFNLFKYMKTDQAKQKIAQKEQSKIQQVRRKRKQFGKRHRQKIKQKKQAERMRLEKEEEQKKLRMRRNYVIHAILAEIYLKKYDIQNNDDHINSLVTNIVSQLAFKGQSQLVSPEEVSKVEKVSKEYHLRQIKRFKGITKYLDIANKKIAQEKKKVKTELAKNFLKTWYESLVCHVTFAQEKLFQYAQHEAAQYESNQELFIQDPENLVLLNQFLKDTENRQKLTAKLGEASKSGSWTQEMTKRYKKFLIALKKSDEKSGKGRFSIMFMQFLVDDYEKDGSDQEIGGKSLLQIFTSMKQKWLCSSKKKVEKSVEMEVEKEGTFNSQKRQQDVFLQADQRKQIQKKEDELKEIPTKETFGMGLPQKMVEEKMKMMGDSEYKMVNE